MDKNRKRGMEHQFKGAVKEITGKITGDKPRELAGKAEKNLGKAQQKVGEASEALRDAVRKDS